MNVSSIKTYPQTKKPSNFPQKGNSDVSFSAKKETNNPLDKLSPLAKRRMTRAVSIGAATGLTLSLFNKGGLPQKLKTIAEVSGIALLTSELTNLYLHTFRKPKQINNKKTKSPQPNPITAKPKINPIEAKPNISATPAKSSNVNGLKDNFMQNNQFEF